MTENEFDNQPSPESIPVSPETALRKLSLALGFEPDDELDSYLDAIDSATADDVLEFVDKWQIRSREIVDDTDDNYMLRQTGRLVAAVGLYLRAHRIADALEEIDDAIDYLHQIGEDTHVAELEQIKDLIEKS